MGSNIERYAVLLAGPLLLCARRGRLTPVAAAALGVIVVWVLWGPVRETVAVAGERIDERGLLPAGRALPASACPAAPCGSRCR